MANYKQFEYYRVKINNFLSVSEFDGEGEIFIVLKKFKIT